ncbi:MAG: response regulator [Pirellulales bacterium]|nr:response regulator [Pirellulales bacterium]
MNASSDLDAQTQHVDTAGQTAPGTILAIDDDPDVTRAIRRRFRPLGVEVIEAVHGMQGISEALLHKPKVIITDLIMPQGQGVDVVACLRNNLNTRHIPIIVLTGRLDGYQRRMMEEYGVEAYLTKPVAFERLREVVAQYIDLPAESPVRP